MNIEKNPCLKKCDIQKFSYKTTCDLLWDMSCKSSNSDSENSKLKTRFSECAVKRNLWKLNCVKPSCFNEGHNYAIQRMLEKARKC